MKNKPLIVLIGPAYPLRGGIANFNESFAYSLLKAGYEVKIVSFYLQYPEFLFPGKTQLAEGDPPPDLEIHPLLSSVNPLSWNKAGEKIHSWSPDLVVIRFWMPFMGPALGNVARQLRQKKISVIGLVDNAIPHERGMLDPILSNRFFKNCDAFFTLSGSVADDLRNMAPGKPIGTSPHPIYDIFGETLSREQALKDLNLDPDYKYILFFGFIRKYKGLDLLIEGFAKSHLSLKKVKLLVAGEFYDDEKPYRDAIRDLDMEKDVILHSHYIPKESVKSYFCAASIVAQTYRSATQSGVTQIAYHFERPILVTDVGGLAEIIPNEKVGYVVKPSPDAIAAALKRFFEENKEEEFATAARMEKDRFTWPQFTENFLAFSRTITAQIHEN